MVEAIWQLAVIFGLLGHFEFQMKWQAIMPRRLTFAFNIESRNEHFHLQFKLGGQHSYKIHCPHLYLLATNIGPISF